MAALDGQRTVLVAHQAESAAIGTRLFASEGLSLLLQKGAEGALGQASRRCGRDLFHGLEVEWAVASALSVEATSDDFSPLGGGAEGLAPSSHGPVATGILPIPP